MNYKEEATMTPREQIGNDKLEEEAKRYNDALERAKRIKRGEGNWRYSDLIEIVPALTEIFPELKESEDERIRKEMIHWLKGFIGEEEGYGYTEGEIRERIAYLEKQKEQKPADEQDYAGLNDLERAIHRGFLVAGVENVPVTIIKETAQECLAQTKPSEWSREDVKMIGIAISFVQVASCNSILGVDKLDVIAWLKALRSGILNGNSHRKPSEEQINALKEIDVNQ